MASPSDNTPPSMPPRPGSGPETEIDPQLENVLRNLNVNLEDELARYRRQRHGRVPPPPPPRRAAQRKTLDLISVSAASVPGETMPGGVSQSPPPPPPNPFTNKISESEEDIDLPDMESLSDLGESGESVLEMDESALAESEADNSALPIHSSDSPTDGYLESSEELLKSIEDEQTEPDSVPEPYSPERKGNGLLKLAGVVLVLLGGIGAGFAITYPSQVQNLRSRLWPAGESEAVDAETTDGEMTGGEVLPEVPDAPSESAAVPDSVNPDGYKPPGPDLSTREFKELDDVEDLVTLDVDGGASNSAAAPVPSAPANPAQSPLPAPTTSPATGQPLPTSPTTTTAAAPATTAPTGSAPAAPVTTDSGAVTGSNFYVIASYTGDASLDKARELVPDAFVRNFQSGARIQLAAFDNRAQAEDQVGFLTQQGAVVELFGPTNE